MTNSFTGTGIQAKLAGILYELLMTRKDMSYEDVLIKYGPNRYSVNYYSAYNKRQKLWYVEKSIFHSKKCFE